MRRNRRIAIRAAAVLASYLPAVLVQAAVLLPRGVAGTLILPALGSLQHGFREGNRRKLRLLCLAVLSAISAWYLSVQDHEAAASRQAAGAQSQQSVATEIRGS